MFVFKPKVEDIAQQIEFLGIGRDQGVGQAQRLLFFVAHQFTGIPGRFVKIEDTIRGFKEIAEGKHDDLPEQAFYMVGSIEEAIAKAKTL
mgnify:CR=1 FL=1